MVVAAPIARKTLEDAIHAWITSTSGISALWGNQSPGNPQLEKPYAMLRALSLDPFGQDELRNEDVEDPDEGAEIELTSCGLRRLVVSCNVFADVNQASLDARAFADKAIAALGLPDVVAALDLAGLGSPNAGNVQSLDQLESTGWVSRAQFDVSFCVASNVSQFSTYIETVEVTSPFGNATFEVEE